MTIDRLLEGLKQRDPRAIGRAISLVENGDESAEIILSSLDEDLISKATILGITGPPRSRQIDPDQWHNIPAATKQKERIGIIAIDPFFTHFRRGHPGGPHPHDAACH